MLVKEDMSESKLYTLVYTSRAIRSFSEGELDALLEQSRTRNSAAGITGMLVHLAGSFMQVLEGSEQAVTELFAEKISNDPRHGLIEVAAKGPISERKFEGWTMAFADLDRPDRDRPDGYSEFIEKGFTTELASGHKAVSAAILHRFRKVHAPLDKLWRERSAESGDGAADHPGEP